MAIPERRRVQRIRFAAPLKGRVRGRRVAILDLSTDGVCIQHHMPFKSGNEIELELEWNDQTISLKAVVTRCSLSHYTPEPKSEPVHHSGLQFIGTDEMSRLNLKALIEDFLRKSLDEGRGMGGGALPADIGEMPLEVWLRNKLK